MIINGEKICFNRRKTNSAYVNILSSHLYRKLSKINSIKTVERTKSSTTDTIYFEITFYKMFDSITLSLRNHFPKYKKNDCLYFYVSKYKNINDLMVDIKNQVCMKYNEFVEKYDKSI